MFPAAWIERFPDVSFLGRLRSWLEPSRSSIPDFGEVSFGFWRPSMDLCEAVHEFVVRVELPGLAPDQVHVHCDAGILTVSGTREETREVEEIGFPLRERSFGSFSRSVRLPSDADDRQVRTSLAHGLLTVRVRKRDAPGTAGRFHRPPS